MSTPYDLDAVDHLNSYVSAFKIGSGDVAWNDMLLKVSSQLVQQKCRSNIYDFSVSHRIFAISACMRVCPMSLVVHPSNWYNLQTAWHQKCDHSLATPAGSW